MLNRISEAIYYIRFNFIERLKTDEKLKAQVGFVITVIFLAAAGFFIMNNINLEYEKSCYIGYQCLEGNCVNGICKPSYYECDFDKNCPGDSYCVGYRCEKKKDEEASCEREGECLSGNCYRGFCRHEQYNCETRDDCENDSFCNLNNTCDKKKEDGQQCGFEFCKDYDKFLNYILNSKINGSGNFNDTGNLNITGDLNITADLNNTGGLSNTGDLNNTDNLNKSNNSNITGNLDKSNLSANVSGDYERFRVCNRSDLENISDSQCLSENCLGYVCRPAWYRCEHNYSRCAEYEYCLTNHSCAPRKNLSSNCTFDKECLSDNCFKGVCTREGYDCDTILDCKQSEYCDNNSCRAKKENNVSCKNETHCLSGSCFKGFCRPPEWICDSDDDCESGEYCDYDLNHTCRAKKHQPAPCTRDGQCHEGYCDGGSCRYFGCANDEDCPENSYCENCLSTGAISCGPPPYHCAPKKKEGNSCNRGAECLSGRCATPQHDPEKYTPSYRALCLPPRTDSGSDSENG